MLRSRRLVPWLVSASIIVATRTALAAPPAEGDASPPAEGDAAPPAEGDAAPPTDGDATPPAEEDEWGPVEGEGEGGDAPAEGGDAPAADAPAGDGDGDEDWEDDWEDDAGGDGDDDYTGPVFEDVSDDPEAQAEQMIKQEEVKGASGKATGKLLDQTTGTPLQFVEVLALDEKGDVTDYVTSANAEGVYEIVLPPGKYQLQFSLDGYQAKIIPITVKKDETYQVPKTELGQDDTFSDTIAIETEFDQGSAVAKKEERLKAEEVSDTISSEEVKKSGGGSVSNVARRIVGATVLNNRYIVVRGLSHRYTNTFLDGGRVSSPNPTLRTVPLDIFPSGALSAIKVIKTFSPDLSADMTAGSIRLESRAIPEDFDFSLGIRTGINTVTTFQDFQRDFRFAADAFGFGNLQRGLPSGLPDFRVNNQTVTQEELEAVGESLFSQTEPIPMTAPPNYTINSSVGNSHQVGKHDHKIGWTLSARLSDKYQRKDYKHVRQYSAVDVQGTLSDSAQLSYSGPVDERNTGLSGIALLKYAAGKNHDLRATAFYSRRAKNEVREWDGTAFSVISGANVLTTRQRYVMESILFTQLGGEHRFPIFQNKAIRAKKKNGEKLTEVEQAQGLDLTIDWFGSFSQARRDDPSLRETLYLEDVSGDFFLSTTAGNPVTNLFQEVGDNSETGALNIKVPFKQWINLEGYVKAGAWVEGKQRGFRVRRFNYAFVTGANANGLPAGPTNVLDDEFVGGAIPPSQGGTAPLFVRDQTRDSDNYDGNQVIGAGYAMLALPLARWLRVVGGARFEHSRIEVRPFDPFPDPNDPSGGTSDQQASLTDNDVFPSASLIFPFGKDNDRIPGQMNVRVTGTQTIERPEMRELAPFGFADFIGGTNSFGNEFLNSSKTWNVDLRWEWAPNTAEIFAISAFAKFLDQPIEKALTQGTSRFLSTWLNAASGVNYGGEIEAKKNFDFAGRQYRDKESGEKIAKKDRPMKPGLRWLSDLSLGVNLAIIYSQVDVGEVPESCADGDVECDRRLQFSAATNSVRPLQGQSPYVVNAFIDYDSDRSGTSVRLLYNTFGRKIASVGGAPLPDVYEEPRHSVDLIFAQRIFRFVDSVEEFDQSTSHELKFLFQVENIANSPIRFTQGNDGAFFDDAASNDLNYYKLGQTISLGLRYQY